MFFLSFHSYFSCSRFIFRNFSYFLVSIVSFPNFSTSIFDIFAFLIYLFIELQTCLNHHIPKKILYWCLARLGTRLYCLEPGASRLAPFACDCEELGRFLGNEVGALSAHNLRRTLESMKKVIAKH